jgi:hypothetical protein
MNLGNEDALHAETENRSLVRLRKSKSPLRTSFVDVEIGNEIVHRKERRPALENTLLLQTV